MKPPAGLILGVALAALAWLALIAAFSLGDRAIPWPSVIYNFPITVVFTGLVSHMAHAALLLGPNRFLRAYTPLGIVWFLGAILLYLRLVMKSVDISGHMSWSVLMGAQCLIQRLPLWFTLAAWAVVLQVLHVKFVVYGGYNGHKGLAAGIGLAILVWLAALGRADLRYRTRL
jgi:hypothetical protein